MTSAVRTTRDRIDLTAGGAAPVVTVFVNATNALVATAEAWTRTGTSMLSVNDLHLLYTASEPVAKTQLSDLFLYDLNIIQLDQTWATPAIQNIETLYFLRLKPEYRLSKFVGETQSTLLGGILYTFLAQAMLGKIKMNYITGQTYNVDNVVYAKIVTDSELAERSFDKILEATAAQDQPIIRQGVLGYVGKNQINPRQAPVWASTADQGGNYDQFNVPLLALENLVYDMGLLRFPVNYMAWNDFAIELSATAFGVYTFNIVAMQDIIFGKDTKLGYEIYVPRRTAIMRFDILFPLDQSISDYASVATVALMSTAGVLASDDIEKIAESVAIDLITGAGGSTTAILTNNLIVEITKTNLATIHKSMSLANLAPDLHTIYFSGLSTNPVQVIQLILITRVIPSYMIHPSNAIDILNSIYNALYTMRVILGQMPGEVPNNVVAFGNMPAPEAPEAINLMRLLAGQDHPYPADWWLYFLGRVDPENPANGPVVDSDPLSEPTNAPFPGTDYGPVAQNLSATMRAYGDLTLIRGITLAAGVASQMISLTTVYLIHSTSVAVFVRNVVFSTIHATARTPFNNHGQSAFMLTHRTFWRLTPASMIALTLSADDQTRYIPQTIASAQGIQVIALKYAFDLLPQLADGTNLAVTRTQLVSAAMDMMKGLFDEPDALTLVPLLASTSFYLRVSNALLLLELPEVWRTMQEQVRVLKDVLTGMADEMGLATECFVTYSAFNYSGLYPRAVVQSSADARDLNIIQDLSVADFRLQLTTPATIREGWKSTETTEWHVSLGRLQSMGIPSIEDQRLGERIPAIRLQIECVVETTVMKVDTIPSSLNADATVLNIDTLEEQMIKSIRPTIKEQIYYLSSRDEPDTTRLGLIGAAAGPLLIAPMNRNRFTVLGPGELIAMGIPVTTRSTEVEIRPSTPVIYNTLTVANVPSFVPANG